MKITTWLYKLARLSRDIEVISSGSPKKGLRRGKNKILGKTVAKKIWRFPF